MVHSRVAAAEVAHAIIAVGAQLASQTDVMHNLDFVVDSLSEAYFSESQSKRQSLMEKPLAAGTSPDLKNLNTIKEDEDLISRASSFDTTMSPEDIEIHISLVAALENSGIHIYLTLRSLELGYIYSDHIDKRLASTFPRQFSIRPI